MEEPAHLRLERMRQEREEEQRLAKLRAAENALEAERKAREWQAELAQLQERRANMGGEELEKDCLPYFATFEMLYASQPPEPEVEEAVPMAAPTPVEESSTRSVGARMHGQSFGSLTALGKSSQHLDDEVAEAPPDGALELWLAERSRRSSPVPDDAPVAVAPFAPGWSCGELDDASCADMARSLRQAIAESAKEADATASDILGGVQQEPGALSERLDKLVEKYAPKEPTPEEDIVDGSVKEESAAVDGSSEGQPPDGVEEAQTLAARAVHHRAVGDRLEALLPCLEDDLATTRLVVALAALDLGSGAPAETGVRRGGLLVGFRAPLLALSTADVCWALRSEKRHLVFERLLPGAGAHDRWLWPELRCTGVGWWLCGRSCLELLDKLVTKLAQSKVSQLRHHLEKEKEWDMDQARTSQALAKGYVDEALFWHSLLGTKLTTLRALARTGLLSSEPAMTALLEHHLAGDAHFLRKNAFRLLQLHRYYLAAALFVLSDSMEEAVRVVAGHLRDLQLAMVLTRRRHEAAEPLLLDCLRESSLARRDPWLRLLLGWHMGDSDVIAQCAQEQPPSPTGGGQTGRRSDRRPSLLPELFDGTLRCSGGSGSLQEVAGALGHRDALLAR